MKKFASALQGTLLAGMVMLCLALPTAGTAAPHEAGWFDNITSDSSRHWILPVGQFGYEVITEGTANYTVSRTMRARVPFDLDFTIIYAWGYTGDTFTIKVTDLGDRGDRLFAVATAVVDGRSTTEWGTMYSSSSQDSFEVIMPLESQGVIYLISGYLTPSLGNIKPYSYTMTFAFPR